MPVQPSDAFVPSFADLDPHLDWAQARLCGARQHLSNEYLDGALDFPTFAEAMTTLLECARWVERRRQLRAHVQARLGEIAAHAAAPFQPARREVPR
jgi:hypothetical protein